MIYMATLGNQCWTEIWCNRWREAIIPAHSAAFEAIASKDVLDYLMEARSTSVTSARVRTSSSLAMAWLMPMFSWSLTATATPLRWKVGVQPWPWSMELIRVTSPLLSIQEGSTTSLSPEALPNQQPHTYQDMPSASFYYLFELTDSLRYVFWLSTHPPIGT